MYPNYSSTEKKYSVLSIAASVNKVTLANTGKNEAFLFNKTETVILDNFTILNHVVFLPCQVPVKTDHYGLVLCHQGSCLKTSGAFEFKVEPRSLHFISPYVLNSYRNISPDLHLSMVLFKKDFLTSSFLKETILDQLTEINPEIPPYFELSDESFQLYKSLIDKIDLEYRSSSPFHLQIIKLLILQLLYEMNRTCEECLLNSARQVSRQYQLVLKFKKLVNDSFLQMKTVQEYADQLDISAKYLGKIVRQETGESALGIIHNRLNLEAKYLLTSSTASIKEIAYHLGFDTTSHFSRFFKKISGKNPSDWR